MRVLRIRILLKKAPWAKQITVVRDNFYIILNSFKNSKRFENIFKLKILK